MTETEEKYFEKFEEDIKSELGYSDVTKYPGFLFSSYDEFKNEFNNEKVGLQVEYDYERMIVYGLKKERFIHYLWMTFPLLVIIASIVLAIMTANWFILIASPLTIVGFYLASPHSKTTKPIYLIGSIAFIVSFFLWDWSWSFVIGSLPFSQYFSMMVRQTYRKAIIKRALYSETLFLWFLHNQIIKLKFE